MRFKFANEIAPSFSFSRQNCKVRLYKRIVLEFSWCSERLCLVELVYTDNYYKCVFRYNDNSKWYNIRKLFFLIILSLRCFVQVYVGSKFSELKSLRELPDGSETEKSVNRTKQTRKFHTILWVWIKSQKMLPLTIKFMFCQQKLQEKNRILGEDIDRLGSMQAIKEMKLN